MDGSRSKPAGHGLDWFNAAPDADLRAALSACCAADSWVARVGGGRPYPDEDGLYAASDAATAALDDAGLGQALAAHPRIGERAAGRNGGYFANRGVATIYPEVTVAFGDDAAHYHVPLLLSPFAFSTYRGS